MLMRGDIELAGVAAGTLFQQQATPSHAIRLPCAPSHRSKMPAFGRDKAGRGADEAVRMARGTSSAKYNLPACSQVSLVSPRVGNRGKRCAHSRKAFSYFEPRRYAPIYGNAIRQPPDALFTAGRQASFAPFYVISVACHARQSRRV